MNGRRLPPPSSFGATLDALGLALASAAMGALAFWLLAFPQKMAQKPAEGGVMTFHLGTQGDLRLWNQPIRAQDLPSLLEKAGARGTPDLIVRLVPDPGVPWGITHRVLTRLQPSPPQRWTLQLQMP